MPTEEKSQHDFISERRFAAGRTEVSFEEFFLGIIVEKEKRYEVQFASLKERLDRVQSQLNQHESLPGHLETRSDINVLTAQIQASNQAVKVAMDATEHRLAGLNELRNAMADQQQLFAKKEVIDTSLKAINDKIDSAESLASVGSGRQLGIATTMTAMGVVVALLLSLGELLVLLLKH